MPEDNMQLQQRFPEAAEPGHKERPSLVTSGLVALVGFCARRAWLVLAIALLVTIGSGYYAARHFSIDTNTDHLISQRIDWRQRQLAFNSAFPQLYQRIIVVIDGATPELADASADRLTAALKPRTDLFSNISRVDALPFFRHDGLLFNPLDEVQKRMQGLAQVQPLFGTLSADPNLRGFGRLLVMSANGLQSNPGQAQQFTSLFDPVASTIDDVLAGKKTFFSWQTLLAHGQPADPRATRRFIAINPILDFSALEPGHAATTAIRDEVAKLGLSGDNGVRVRLTGDVPMADDEFATLAEGAWVNNLLTVLVVAFLLWAALKSPKIVFAILASVLTGLAITAALGLALVGALNLISVAFAVLFVGIGADFGIQFSVRYRAERHATHDLYQALLQSAARAGRPLALAATATACGFLAFLPTDYRGVSELGLIAGLGMIVAFFTSVTVLPAALTVLKPPGEEEPIGYAFLAPVDRFLARHRWPIIIGTLVVVLAGSPLLRDLHFDFNPLNLRSPKVESVATLLDLMKDPVTSYNTIDVVSRDADAARAMADRLQKLPEVARVTWLGSFVPQDQAPKIAAIQQAARTLLPALQRPPQPAPTDEEAVASLRQANAALTPAAGAVQGAPSDSAKRLADALARLADASPDKRAAVDDTIMTPFNVTKAGLEASLQPEPATLDTLPPELVHDWRTADGRFRIEAAPKGDPNDNDNLRRFTKAVQAIAPDAAGAPIAIQGAGDTIVKAFIEAGAWALISISILLYIVLRRVVDVLLTLVPLLIAGMVTLEICVLIDMPLNFANIIALPLLLGLGVAFKIYFVMAWRAGVTNLLQSSLTRAVFFSALTTATAFGSLWLSNHPGTSSMGKLLALSLVTTLAAAVLFQPALMGPPRQKHGEEVT